MTSSEAENILVELPVELKLKESERVLPMNFDSFKSSAGCARFACLHAGHQDKVSIRSRAQWKRRWLRSSYGAYVSFNVFKGDCERQMQHDDSP